MGHRHPDWPRQLRLPGQVAAPDGPVDPFVMYLMHHAFRRDLAAFAAVVPRTPVTDRATWRALCERWATLARALLHHHEGEDAWLWPALLDGADDHDRRTLEAMAAEHSDLDPLLPAIEAGFAALAQGTEDERLADIRAALGVRLCAAREALARHLAHEETEAMRILQARFTPDDWAAVEERFSDGVGFATLLSLVPWALHEVPASVLPELFQRTGTVHRLIWRLTRRRFARAEAAAFRYAA